MRAIIHTTYGTSDVLRLSDVPLPAPGADEVRIRVVAAALNQADRHLLSGGLRFSSGLRRPKQPILGSDVAGVVDGVGANVTRLRVGDAVFGDLSAHGRGGFAEYVVAPADAFVARPDNLSFAAAAATPMTGATALQGLRDRGRLQPGEQVLVNGGAGGVGSFAVQIARALGGTVTAVGSARSRAVLERLGADHVVDYRQEDVTGSRGPFDLILDTVANHSVSAWKRILKPGGRYVAVAFSMSAQLLGPWIRLREGKEMGNMLAQPRREDLQTIARMLETGQVTPLIDRCFPLADVPAAFRYLEDGGPAGKVIIAVDGSIDVQAR